MTSSRRHAGGPSSQRRLRRVTIPLVAVVVAVLGAGPAWAHNALISTTPGDGKTVRTPTSSVVLTFAEPAIKTGTRVLVTGPDGSVTDGHPQLVGARVEQDLKAELPAGEYTVEWRVSSADGHPISGRFSFTVRTGTLADESVTPTPSTSPTAPPASTPASTPAGAPTVSATPPPTVAAPSPTGAPTLPTEPGNGTGAESRWWWLLAVIPLGLAAALGWRFSRRGSG